MNYTENYHLPQWDETDRILRKDFNSAMAQLEEGLTGNRDTAEDLRQSGGEMDEKNLKRLCRLTYNHYCAVTSMNKEQFRRIVVHIIVWITVIAFTFYLAPKAC